MGPIIYILPYEYFLLPVYLILIFWVTKIIAKRYYTKNYRAVFLYGAVGFKLLGSMVFAFMSQFFFKEGDTFMYFSSGLDIQKAVLQNFPSSINLLFIEPGDFGQFYEANFSNSNNYGYISSTPNLFTAKVSSFLSLFAFNGYLLTSLLFGLVALSGMWRLFILFTSLFPSLSKQWSMCFLFLPSIVYWGGGVMKDTICLAALGWLFTSFYYYFIANRKKWIHLLIMIVTFYLLFNVKVYIAGSMLLVLVIWYVLKKISSIPNTNIKVALTLIFIVAAVSFLATSSFISDQLMSGLVEYIADAKKNYALSSSDSALMTNVTDVTMSVMSIVSNIPAAINNALFRPYLWESTSLNIFFAGLENFVILALSAFVVVRRWASIIPRIFTVQIVAICFIFSILFAVVIGLTCFNFGTMVRYKLPCTPFYCATLFLLYHHTLKPKKI